MSSSLLLLDLCNMQLWCHPAPGAAVHTVTLPGFSCFLKHGLSGEYLFCKCLYCILVTSKWLRGHLWNTKIFFFFNLFVNIFKHMGKHISYDLVSTSLCHLSYLFDFGVNKANCTPPYKVWVMLNVSAPLSAAIFTSPCSLWLHKCCLSSPHFMGWLRNAD